MADRIVDEVPHDALEPSGVRAQSGRVTQYQVRVKTPSHQQFASERPDVGDLPLRRVVRLEPADLQEIEQHLRHPAHLGSQDGDPLPLPIRQLSLPRLEQFRRPEDRGEGRAQLMADVGAESPLPLNALLHR
jgi:hypothetical protein